MFPSHDPDVNEYNEDFKTRFIKRFKKDKYVIAPEKAGDGIVNHYQIFLDTETRTDSVKRFLHKTLSKGMTFKNPNAAFCVKTNNSQHFLGYVLKEQDNLDMVVYGNVEPNYLLAQRDAYLQLSKDNKIKVDKIRVTERNFYEVFMVYYESKKDIYGEIQSHDILTDIVYDMVREGYYCFNLLTNKQKLQRILEVVWDLYKNTRFSQ